MLIITVLVGLFALLFISATIAPLGSLGWWAGWYGEEVTIEPLDDTFVTDNDEVDFETVAQVVLEQEVGPKQLPKPSDIANRTVAAKIIATVSEPLQGFRSKPKSSTPHFIIYLSGVGAFTGSSIPQEEYPFIQALREEMPECVVITDVFPYSTTNLGLTGERLFARLWRMIEAQRPQNPNSIWLYFVVLRNVFQVLVSVDRRYGPIYNLGVAREIWRSLLRHGYQPGSNAQVTFIGASGGAQISVGAAPYLSKVFEIPVQIISLGGVVASNAGLLKIKHLYHLYGSNDYVHLIGPLLFPGRWPITWNSAWNKAKRRGLITMKETGPADHVGADSQFDQKAIAPDGRSYFQITLDEVLAILRGETA